MKLNFWRIAIDHFIVYNKCVAAISMTLVTPSISGIVFCVTV